MRIFLHMYGTATDPQFANDGAMAARPPQAAIEAGKGGAALHSPGGARPFPRHDHRNGNAEPRAPRHRASRWSGKRRTAPARPCRRRKDVPRKGLGRLLKEDRDKEEQERIRIEDLSAASAALRELHPTLDLYSRKQRWKLVLAVVAMLIVGASLWYSNRIVDRVRAEERKKVELWAEAVQNRAELVNYTEKLFDRLRDEERKKVQLLGRGHAALGQQRRDATSASTCAW